MKGITRALVVTQWLCVCAAYSLGETKSPYKKYSNTWVAKIRGGEKVAERIARDLGYKYKGQCGELTDYYEFIREDHPKVSLRDSGHLTSSLLEYDEVQWANQEAIIKTDIHNYRNPEKERKKFLNFLKLEAQKQAVDINSKCSTIFACIDRIPRDYDWFLWQTDQYKGFLSLGSYSTKPKLTFEGEIEVPTKNVELLSLKISAYILRFNDPFWRKQWYMQDYRVRDIPVMDLNVVPVHNMGYTGKGVTVAVVDNGVEHDNFDIEDNFISELSFDLCKGKAGSHPGSESHGTNCAGVIAMKVNNGLCGVGIAFNAKVVGVKAICEDEEQMDLVLDKSKVHAFNKIDIYSMSLGKNPEGREIANRRPATDEAYKKGVTEGRNGKGVIYVKTSGNDKLYNDNCAVDPEINSPFVITIASANQFGAVTDYSERCTAVFAAAYSDGSDTEEGIVAPDLKGKCVTTFGGTSAACSLASGIIALVLEANPKLTYRDVMHLITMSTEVAPLASAYNSWYRNGQGFWVSNDYGFGLLNAENMVTLAKDWKNVPELHTCVVSVDTDSQKTFKKGQPAEITFDTQACRGSNDEVNYLEHIEVSANVEFPFRGHILVYVTSPTGTYSQLLEHRKKDDNKGGLEGVSIISTHNWGERPQGKWTVTYAASFLADISHTGKVHQLVVKFYGTVERPVHYQQKREYAVFRTGNGNKIISASLTY